MTPENILKLLKSDNFADNRIAIQFLEHKYGHCWYNESFLTRGGINIMSVSLYRGNRRVSYAIRESNYTIGERDFPYDTILESS